MSNKTDPEKIAIGYFGGTFDPIHNGHLSIAQFAKHSCQLDTIKFLPTPTPPHKTSVKATDQQRLKMVELAIQGIDGFEIELCEFYLPAPHYTLTTLQQLRQQLGQKPSICWIMGYDSFLDLPNWDNWRKIFDYCHLLVAKRLAEGTRASLPLCPTLQKTLHQYKNSDPLSVHQKASGNIILLENDFIDISSTHLRAQLKTQNTLQHNSSYALPGSVLEFIDHYSLYR